MLPTDVMVYAVDPPLQRGKVPFYGIGRDAHAVFVANVFFSRVVNLVVLAVGIVELNASAAVRHHMNAFGEVFVQNRTQILLRHAAGMKRADASAALYERKNNFFLGVWMNAFRCSNRRLLAPRTFADLYVFFSLLWTAARIVLASPLSADICFVDFYNAIEF